MSNPVHLINGNPVPMSDADAADHETARQAHIAAATERAMAELRRERNRLIEDVQWRILRHNDEVSLGVALSEEDITPVRVYVQALRDLPANTDDPFNPVWPTKPAGG
jgi:hypothetical protein